MTQIEKPTVPSILENESAIEIEPKNILEFLAKNKPRENRERAEDLKELGLIQSFEQKVVDYKNKLKEKGLKEADAHELAMNYGEELKYSQQDPREYVGLMNRAGSSAELGRELTRAIPEEEK